jgi:protein-tyrosine-phosphatase
VIKIDDVTGFMGNTDNSKMQTLAILPPLFICHANCCRSALAQYLYEHLFPECKALSAGVEVGECLNDRAEAMLHWWGIHVPVHKPRKIDLEVCNRAGAIFLMSPEHMRRLFNEYDRNLACRSYLFANPFSLPESFRNDEYVVHDPSFDNRPAEVLTQEYEWFRERVVQIRYALQEGGKGLIPAVRYLAILERDLARH